ncbi:TraR/DksA C4-type zinc finger protein [Vibrio fluvialis]|uniref:TraR/DksA C4-type zinc finger protein n=1 Tax=Vibrio furnissii TaxID=29494 RepID=UPI0013022F96|nr:TraR/DksA C4-type zinc finger protein [Vibrio fluvialis]EKO3509336.1 TraR/DksA C4-type zinc finger protein [Vibrio fluvialis]EKO3522603.1 TraR/DksA C4-type zinc finger protein [Vibrio fluvialis]EKO3528284.1 TraR/DksA C4-type zinc finger protein [Vibrio fluvialis]EKO3543284.1 TraR/DksA C4-type zinc finger protein [Vibrio fluvialis]
MDFCDDAAETEAKFQQMALANHLAGAKPDANTESETHCLECDEEIPQGRRDAIKGCKWCTACQAKREG